MVPQSGEVLPSPPTLDKREPTLGSAGSRRTSRSRIDAMLSLLDLRLAWNATVAMPAESWAPSASFLGRPPQRQSIC
eukprot:scaffold2119_cov264-Pinguiococcus_pyrenoidosus.AAC.15